MELTSLMKVDSFLLRTPLLGGRNEMEMKKCFLDRGVHGLFGHSMLYLCLSMYQSHVG